MNSRRLLLITRRYWPLVGGAERAMAGLAHQFQSEGHQVRLLTAKWENHWPEEIVHREVPVTRLANPKTRGWGTLRYMTVLKRWLRNHSSEFDAALVSMLKHDAHVTIKTLSRLGKPTVVRAEGSGPTGDCAFHQSARFGGRIKKTCQQAAAIIAPSETVYRELETSGFPSEKLHLIPNGVETGSQPLIQPAQARRSLAEAHPILSIDPGEPLVVYTGRLDQQKGLLDLVEAWKSVAAVFPRGRLWLVGEGTDGPAVWDRIRETRQTNEIILPGSFDDVSDLLRAADVFVLPSYQEGMSLSLLEAMAQGVPVVVSDIPGNRALVDETRGFLFPVRDAAALGTALLTAIQNQKQAGARAAAAQAFITAHYSLERMASAHLQVIEQSLADRQQPSRLVP